MDTQSAKFWVNPIVELPSWVVHLLPDLGFLVLSLARCSFWLAVPTSILGFTLIPVAYLSFFLLMNNLQVLGRERPEGTARFIWNLFMILALVVWERPLFM